MRLVVDFKLRHSPLTPIDWSFLIISVVLLGIMFVITSSWAVAATCLVGIAAIIGVYGWLDFKGRRQ